MVNINLFCAEVIPEGFVNLAYTQDEKPQEDKPDEPPESSGQITGQRVNVTKEAEFLCLICIRLLLDESCHL